MTQTEFLSRVRSNEGLRRAVLHKISVDTHARTCLFDLVTDLPYTQEDERAAQEAVREAVPAALEPRLRIRKLVADEQIVRHKILEYLDRSHRAAAACIRAEDIGVSVGETVEFTFGVA